MSCFNFIIMKVNGTDVSNLPYEDAVQLFVNAEEPIIVEVRRKCLNENNKLSFFNYNYDSPYKSPTLAVIASNNAPLHSHVRKDSINDTNKPANITISCQTDLSVFDDESKILFMKSENNAQREICLKTPKSKPKTTTDILLEDEFDDDFLETDLDFEEITLKKSKSTENLGFTISYSTDDFLASDFGSNECDEEEECTKLNKLPFRDDFFESKFTPKCKIYVSDIIPNSIADQDGRLRHGDQILQINGQNVLEKIDPDKLLTENKYAVKILVSRQVFGGDDDFLDSAVYCDDKECQEDKHVSSIYEFEQNTFSSSASCQLGKQDQTKITTITDSKEDTNTNASKILPTIDIENVGDIFSHANIKIQLETVSKEISLLNSQISVIKQLHTTEATPALTTSFSMNKHPQPKQQHQQKQTLSSSPKKIKKNTLKSIKYNECKSSSKESPQDIVEHIYETIPEDADSENYYCSPYEGINEKRVEEWLKSIGCPNSNISTDKNRADEHPLHVRLQKHQNSILDDYDNSSSAYNTGGSCNSAFLALESRHNVHYQRERHNSQTLVSKSQIKTLQSSTERNQTLIYSNQRSSICPKLDKFQMDARGSYNSFRTTGTLIPFDVNAEITDNASLVGTDSDGHSTLVAKSNVYKMSHSKAVDEYKEKDISGMAWKVKRRPDGSRYIVRRVVKRNSTISSEKKHEHSPTLLESAAGIEIDYKRQFTRGKERNRRHHKAHVNPSKEKSHSQHWLV